MSLKNTVAGRTLRSVGLIAALSAIATVAACDNQNWEALSQTNQVGGTDLSTLPGIDGGTVDPAPDMANIFCAVGAIMCGEICRNIMSNPYSCGACDKHCSETEQCIQGVCTGLPPCANGVKDNDESDVDCGGASCERCNPGMKCSGNNDCASKYCNGRTCGCRSSDDCNCGNNGSCGCILQTGTCWSQ